MAVITRIDNVAEVERQIRELARVQILVGVPADEEPHFSAGGPPGKNQRDPNPKSKKPASSQITNAALAYIHNYGSPARNIPARPFMEPGINIVKGQTTALFQQMGEAAFKGNDSATDKIAHAIGILNQSAIRNVIEAKIPPPLKPATKRARLANIKSKKKRAKVMAEDDFTPLIDTGQLVNSISYVIRKARKK